MSAEIPKPATSDPVMSAAPVKLDPETYEISDDSTEAPAVPLLNMMAQFQTSFASGTSTTPIDVSREATPKPMVKLLPKVNSPTAQAPAPAPGTPGDHLKTFQTSFQTLGNSPPGVAGDTRSSSAAPGAFSKTSISSLINVDDEAAPVEKKKRTTKGEGAAAKRARLDTAKKGAKADPKEGKAETKKAVKSEAKGEAKKTVKGKKKTPEVVALPSKPAIHPAMATDKARFTGPAPNIPPPSFMETDTAANASGDQLKQMPVIVLDIPLLDPKNPKPGQAEVVVNVMKLAEKKYGFNVIHPDARLAIDLMEEMLDDEDEGDDDEDDDLQIVDEKGNPTKKKDEPKKEDNKKDELSEEQKFKKQQVKMNRKIGKYDYEDPFIDDAELQWEEEITTTKEGYFVYWGPLVDDRGSSNKKSTSKKK